MQNNILKMEDDEGLDSEYFKQIIDDKLSNKEGSYLETLAMK